MPETRDIIVRAAAKVFSEKGFQDGAIKEIAMEASVHETTLFRHFESKDALLRAVAEWAMEDAGKYLNNIPREWTDDPEKDLKLFAQAYEKAVLKHIGLLRLFIGESGRRGEELQLIVRNANIPFMEQLIGYLEQAKLMGQLRSDLNPSRVAGVLTGIIMVAALRHEKSLLGDTLDEYFDIFIHGILARDPVLTVC